MKIIKTEQGTPEWLELRLGKITGTRLKDVMKPNNLPLLYELLAEMFSDQGKENATSRAMERGTDEEPHALKAYMKDTGEIVEEIGFCVSDEFEYLGLSPDGFIKTGEYYTKGVEIKCPNSAKHIEYIKGNKVPNEYKPQVITYFLVNEKMESLDFVSYDRRVLIKPLFIVTVTREELEEEIEEAKKALIKFKAKLDKYHDEIIF